MKNLMKLIVIATMAALLICAVMSFALADEKIYTSPSFKLPADKVMEWAESQDEEPQPEDGEPAEDSEPVEEDAEPGEDAEPVEEDAEPGEDAEPVEEDGEPAEDSEPADENVESTDDSEPEGKDEKPSKKKDEPEEPARRVKIYSSQKEVVQRGDFIYLTSKLEGFDGVDVSYQWQVDRGDGAGWVDVEGANGAKYKFVANDETITYKWRLIVNTEE